MQKLFFVSLLLFSCVGIFLSCKKETCTTCINNRTPIANAGRDTIILSLQQSVTIDGSSSTDPDSNIVAYHWTSISGPTTSIENSKAVRTRVSTLAGGVYKFELTVTDAGGLSSKDTIQLTVASRDFDCNIDSRPVINAHLVPIRELSFGKYDMITASVNNKILFAGGLRSYEDGTGTAIHRVDIYDTNSNGWSTKDLNDSVTWRTDIGIGVVSNKILLAGGGFWGDDTYTNQVDIYNASDNSWSIARLSEYRNGTTGISAGNKVFFAGGYSLNRGWSNTVDIYDDVSNTWSTGTLSEGRGYLSAVAAGNKIFFAGGQKNNGQLLFSDRVDEYDMTTNSRSSSRLREPVTGLAAIAAGNKVFFAGGFSDYGESGTVEIRDVVTGAISFDCIIPRGGLTAVQKDNKIVFFTGSGSDPRNGTHFEIYDLPSGTWSTGLLDKSITRAAVISVNNVIYVAGGLVNGVAQDLVWKLEF